MAYTFDENIVSDLHKDAYGFRPTALFWSMWNTVSDTGRQNIWDGLLDDLSASLDAAGCEEVTAINAFEVEIAGALDLGARSREDAVRWIIQGMKLSDIDMQYGGSYVCFLKGLPYRMQGMFDSVINSLMKEAA